MPKVIYARIKWITVTNKAFQVLVVEDLMSFLMGMGMVDDVKEVKIEVENRVQKDYKTTEVLSMAKAWVLVFQRKILWNTVSGRI